MAVACWLTGLMAGLTACDRGERQAAPPPPTTEDRVSLPETNPTYTFAPELEKRHPEVIAFTRHFLETCLAGDYAGYRRLVTRTADPETRARFERVLHSLESLSVDRVREISLPDNTDPAYLITAHAVFRQDEPAAQRHGRERDLGIIVLLEDDEWRMALAPPQLQPSPESPESQGPASNSAPSYPWDEGIDY